ncbi:MAG TPA: exosortase V [Sphingomonas sp.]|nr:exosortase V [Sphingomonas sp.]
MNKIAPSWRPLATHWLLLLGILAIAGPTMVSVARESWSTEQGAHGPIVLATGIWLVVQLRREFMPLIKPGNLLLAMAMLIPILALYVVARITTTLELEGVALYFALVVIFYAYCGSAVMRLLWFPTFYFIFLFPPPDSLVATLTQPLKLNISRAAVALLDALGMTIARKGVIIQVDQYDILVAAACAGLNSIISLSAIGLFYIYVRHNANWRYALLLMIAIIPVAIVANFVRVLLLILITAFLGDAWAQGFLHGFAGMVMFTVALLGIFGIDRLAEPLRRRLASRGRTQ